MSLNDESLRKVLELECKKGCADSAVFGGLDKFLHKWSAQAIESISSPRLLARFKKLRLIDSDYATLTKDERREWIRSVLDFLAEIEHGAKAPANVTPVPKPQRQNREPGRRWFHHHLTRPSRLSGASAPTWRPSLAGWA
ncbi:MAG: hypothetical protein MUO99_06695 [Dehalococcoidales bacterium]|nr:hypothetical protein [Dehalococcoidales bacterium]